MKYEVRFLEEDLKQPNRNVRDCRGFISAFEANWARPQSDTGWPVKPEEKAFHIDLVKWLQFHQSMLIGELATEMRNYLRNNPLCVERRAFDHVLVDEYQDLNRADQDIIDLLSEAGTLTIIGDEDQAIYSRLRFAQPESIREFPQRHPGTHDRPLAICYRCPKEVVEIANSLISFNVGRELRSLLPDIQHANGEVSILQWETMEKESEGLAQIVREYLDAS